MRIIVAGDYAPTGQIASLLDKGEYSMLSQIKTKLEGIDYSIVNLECPVAESDYKAIEKVGPNLKCSRLSVEALKYVGFNCVTLANNHIKDYGSKGVTETIKTLELYEIDYVGAGASMDRAQKTLIKNIKGESLAVINCCENEFSIASDDNAGANPLDPVNQFYEIQKAKEIATYVLVIVHGGHEGYQLPSPRMQKTYRFFIDAGADAVVNHHQHCFSGFEIYNGKPIFYGLGNFLFEKIFPNSPESWNKGYMVELSFKKERVGSRILPYIQCVGGPNLEMRPGDSFKEEIDRINTIINDSEQLDAQYNSFCKSKYESAITNIAAPVGNRYLLAAANRRLFPIFLSKSRLLRICNTFRCESHRDIALKALEDKLIK